MNSAPIPTNLAHLLQRYFCSYLSNQRRLSHHTIASYRDMFRLLLPFVATTQKKPVSSLSLEDISVEVVLLFLKYLEKQRGNREQTRNARLSAIRSFFAYAAIEEPQALPDIQRIMAIPEKRRDRFAFESLQPDEMKAILSVQDMTTWVGQRDHSLLLTLYNTGARVSEISQVQLKDIDLQRQQAVYLHGKGRKERVVPLWPQTTKELKK